MITVGLVEESFFLRNTCKEYLTCFGNIQFLFIHASIDELRKEILRKDVTAPDVLLVNVELPDISGIEALNIMKEWFPATKFLMISNYDDQDIIVQSIKAGASGFVVKNTLLTELYKAVTDIANGGGYFSANAARQLIEYFNWNVEKTLSEKLSRRELEIIKYVKEGASYKIIAEQLCVSTATINYHLKNIFKKLSVSSKAELIAKILS